MEITSYGCKDNLPKWIDIRRSIFEQPQGFEVDNQENHVCKLKKELYGLKQAPRAWYERIDGFLMSLGFTKSKEDSILYYKVEGDGIMILLLYVDDLFLRDEYKPINECKNKLVA